MKYKPVFRLYWQHYSTFSQVWFNTTLLGQRCCTMVTQTIKLSLLCSKVLYGLIIFFGIINNGTFMLLSRTIRMHLNQTRHLMDVTVGLACLKLLKSANTKFTNKS